MWSGIESLTTVKNTLANSLDDNFCELCIKLKSIHNKFMSQARQILLVCEQRDMIEFTENIKNHALGQHQYDPSPGKIEIEFISKHNGSYLGDKAIDEIVKIIQDFQYNDELSEKYKREILDQDKRYE